MKRPALPKLSFSFSRADTADKLLLSVSARQVNAAHWRGGRIAGSELFSYDDDGLVAFQAYLTEIRTPLPVRMIVDAVEEDYRFESLPHSTGKDRAELVNRKIKQHYRNTPYCSAQLRGRDAGKRRDDHYLFCALTNPDLITGWVQAVTARGLPIAGIYLLPTVSQELVARLELPQTNLLLVSINASGLRLTFLREGTLRVSRLARIDSTGAQAIKSCTEEISNTRLYLHGLRIMTLDEHLTVLVVDSDDTLAGLTEALAHDNPNLECQRLGRAELIARLGIEASALDSSPDALYLHLLGSHAPDSNLAPPEVTFAYRMQGARRGTYAAAGVTALALAAWCAFTWYQILDTNVDIQSDLDNAAAQLTQLQVQYQETARQFPSTPTTAENLQRAVEVAQKLAAATRLPESMMVILGQALDQNPDIRLKTFGWKYARTDGGPQDPGKSAGPGSNPGTASRPRQESGLVAGEVRPFTGDYRAANESISRFAAALSEQPAVAEVKVIKTPLNVSPTLTLSGNTADSSTRAGRAEFELLLTLKPTT